MTDKIQYTPLSKDQEQPFLETGSRTSEDGVSFRCSSKALSPRLRFFMVLGVAINLIAFCASASLSLWAYRTYERGNVRNRWLRETNNFSPLMDDIDLPLQSTKIDGKLLDANHSVYLQDPSPEVDEAWNALSKNDFIHVSKSDIVKMGKDPEVCAKLPEDWGYGSDAYAAELDIIHKIHCLDALRKEMHFDHYYGYKYANRSQITEGHKMHANHCLNILLQTLTCDANTDIVPFVWVKEQTHPFPDFSIMRKCGDLGMITKWKEDRAIDRERYLAWRRPEAEKKLRLLPELMRIFNSID